MIEQSDTRLEPSASRIRRPLDALNFLLADVRGGLGPYLATYLLAVRHWDEASIGLVMSIATLAGLLAQTPAGALVDAAHAKRGLVVTAALFVTFASLSLPWLPDFWPVAVSQAAAHVAAAVFAPAIAAITLGAVGRAAFAHRIGRNESFNHAGNAFAAAVAGVCAYVWGPVVVFFLLAVMSLASIASAVMIPANAIDHDLARGLDDGRPAQRGGREDHDQPSGLKVLITCRPLLVLAVCVVLFHFANAAMLPLVGQKLALKDPYLGTSLMSACIVAAQVVMVPMAMLVGAKADAWGRKPLFLIALIILPIRGTLYTFSDNDYWLVGVQLLDGVGAGIYGTIFPIIVADLMRGTGRFNLAQGAIITAQEVGAALSTAVAGFVVVAAGYSAAFLALAGIAATGLLLFWLGMPETSSSETIPIKPLLDDASVQTGRPLAAPAE
jgi:MFS family permease